MHTTNLRKVGGSVMLAVPPAFLDLLQLRAEPKARPRYTLAELLATSDYSQPQPLEEREWVDAAAAGDELL
jgi:antitoxin ChpS